MPGHYWLLVHMILLRLYNNYPTSQRDLWSYFVFRISYCPCRGSRGLSARNQRPAKNKESATFDWLQILVISFIGCVWCGREKPGTIYEHISLVSRKEFTASILPAHRASSPWCYQRSTSPRGTESLWYFSRNIDPMFQDSHGDGARL